MLQIHILYYAIEAKEEDTVIALLKIIPKQLLFVDAYRRDFLVYLLKKTDCRRSLDYLKSKYPDKIKSSSIIEPQSMPLQSEPNTNPCNIAWNKIADHSLKNAPMDLFKNGLEDYKKAIQDQPSLEIIHYLRASQVAFLLDDFPSAIALFEQCVTQMRLNKTPVTPVSLVNELISELVLRFYHVFMAKLPEKYRELQLTNLCYASQRLANYHEVLLFPVSTVVNYDTLKHASKMLKEGFFKFNRTLTVVQKDYKNITNYQDDIYTALFIVERFYQWFCKLEKENNFVMVFEKDQELKQKLSALKFVKLKCLTEFCGIKKIVLNILEQSYALLEIVDCPYTSERQNATLIELTASKIINNIVIEKMAEYLDEGTQTEPLVTNASNKKKKKKNNKDQKTNINHNKQQEPAKSKKKLEDYRELPTYYPDVVKVYVKSETECQLTLFQNKKSQPDFEPIMAKNSFHDLDLSKNLTHDKDTLSGYSGYAERSATYLSPNLPSKFFIDHPECFLEALYTDCINNMPDILNKTLKLAKPEIGQLLYQVSDGVLNKQHLRIIHAFGKAEAFRIYYHYGVIDTLIKRGIFSTDNSEVDKNVAFVSYRS